jgi:hypothetical protein
MPKNSYSNSPERVIVCAQSKLGGNVMSITEVSLKHLVSDVENNPTVQNFVHSVEQAGKEFYSYVSQDVVGLSQDASTFITTGTGSAQVTADLSKLFRDATTASGRMGSTFDGLYRDGGQLLSQALTGVGDAIIGSGLATTAPIAYGTYEGLRAAGVPPGQALGDTFTALLPGVGDAIIGPGLATTAPSAYGTYEGLRAAGVPPGQALGDTFTALLHS